MTTSLQLHFILKVCFINKNGGSDESGLDQLTIRSYKNKTRCETMKQLQDFQNFKCCLKLGEMFGHMIRKLPRD